MSETGFTMPDGRDLSGIFQPYTSPDVKADETGFTIFGSDLDLNSVFAKNTSGTYIANDTNYTAPSGLDLRYIFEPVVPLAVTITGTGVYTSSIVGNKYTYTFTSGANTISINKNIPALYAIVCGGGGGGRTSEINSSAGGGAGGGFGFVQINYVAGTEYNTSVAASVARDTDGNNSTFLNNSNNGVTARGGTKGSVGSTVGSSGGVCVSTPVSIGTLTSQTGGVGGRGSSGTLTNVNGGDSSGNITVLSTTYRYGGGGGGGGYNNNYGGQAGRTGGLGGVSGDTFYSSRVQWSGQNASSSNPGAGGGGGAYRQFSYSFGGNGGPGIIIVTFQYP